MYVTRERGSSGEGGEAQPRVTCLVGDRRQWYRLPAVRKALCRRLLRVLVVTIRTARQSNGEMDQENVAREILLYIMFIYFLLYRESGNVVSGIYGTRARVQFA